MGISDLMIPSRNDNYLLTFYEASKDPPVEAINRTECGCYISKEFYDSDRCWVTYTDSKTVTSYYLCPEHKRKHLTPVSTIKQVLLRAVTMNTSDALTDFVDQYNVFPTLEDFNASSMRFDAGYCVLDFIKTYC